MTFEYPDDGPRTKAEERYHSTETIPFVDAQDDDIVGCVVGSIGGAKYDKNGVFVLTVEVPFDVIGDPTELMRSQGMMLLWTIRKMS